MEASRRAKGINMPRQAIIKAEHGTDYEFVMALHINDLVSVEKDGRKVFYRVQKLESDSNRIMLRQHIAATLDKKDEEIRLTINKSTFAILDLKKHKINAIGKLVE